MKKYLYGVMVALITIVSFQSEAQTVTRNAGILGPSDVHINLGGTATYANGGDTVGYGSSSTTQGPVWATLTGPDTATYYFELKGSKANITFSTIIDETGSGTLAGTVVISGCNNYTGSWSSWYTLTGLKWKALHSETIVDGDQEFHHVDTANSYRFYKVQIINSASTTVCKAQTWVKANQY